MSGDVVSVVEVVEVVEETVWRTLANGEFGLSADTLDNAAVTGTPECQAASTRRISASIWLIRARQLE
jgi:hypothetical protein